MPRKDAAKRKEYMRDYHSRYYAANREAVLARTVAYDQAHPEKRAVRLAAWREKNREKIREQTKAYYETHKNEWRAGERRRRAANPDQTRLVTREFRRRVRLEVLTKYGLRCVCCGETELAFLTIDHVQGGGRRHRERIGGTTALYNELRRQPKSPDFRILCSNCNCARGFYGTCPHESETVLTLVGRGC